MAIALLGALSLSVEVLGQAPADADDDRALMAEAQAARSAGDHARALSLASRAGQIRMTPSVRLFIAEEQNAVGEIAESMNNAEQCGREAAAAKNLRNGESIVRSCRTLLSNLQKSAARVLISVTPPAPPGTEVTVNGQVLPESLYGQPYFLKAGPIHVEAKAPAHRPFRADLMIPQGEEQALTVSLDRDFGPEDPFRAPVRDPPMPRVVLAPRSSGGIGPYLVLGGGALSFGAAAIFLVVRNGAINDLEKQCSGPNHSICPSTPEARSLQSKISRNNTLANVALGVGGVAVLGGALWLIYDKTRDVGTGPRARLQVSPRDGGAMVGLAGAF